MKEENLLTWEGYYNRYIEHIREGFTNEKSFELVQEEFRELYGRDRVEIGGFSSFYSFKNRITNENKKK